MWRYLLSIVLAIIIFGILMSLRRDTDDVAIRGIVAAVAGGILGFALWYIIQTSRRTGPK